MNKTLTGVLVGSAMLAGGCGAVSGQAVLPALPPTPPTGVPTPGPTGTPTGPTGTPTPGPGRVGLDDLRQAGQAALTAVPGSMLISIETEEDGRLWEVQVVDRAGTEHQMDVAAGKVVAGPTQERDDAEDKAKRRNRVRAAKLGYLEAAEKIVATVPGGRITELSLDGELGRTVWESDVVTADGTKHEVTLDAVTGAVSRPRPTS
ncbi:PepSY domain-containing protein [Nonomuraea sp. SYSU D8015]|uniref:PepSY domain-containing protein n=1 Tax=Nonomuraea sp. SYSU D8015 TaxID=2593644 RepID=UPI001660F3F1|nr:PepSY domain-containing protein [Nonomuraea sp. SYSU D8015]